MQADGLEKNWFLTARWDHLISYLSSHPPRFKPIRRQPPDNTWYFECTHAIQVHYHNSSSQKCVNLWCFFLHSDCWYLVEKEHVKRDTLLCKRRGCNSWMVSLQIQTFRNSLTQSQEKKKKSWLPVHLETPKAELSGWYRSPCHHHPCFIKIWCNLLSKVQLPAPQGAETPLQGFRTAIVLCSIPGSRATCRQQEQNRAI